MKLSEQMKNIATKAMNREKALKKCEDIFTKIAESAEKGEFSTSIEVPYSTYFTLQEILKEEGFNFIVTNFIVNNAMPMCTFFINWKEEGREK